MTWQRSARLVALLVALGVVVAVYTTMGERTTPAPAAVPERVDPSAIIESAGATLQQARGTRRDFDVTSDRQLYYEDGSSRLLGVEIRVRSRAGRDFVLTGREAQATGSQQDLQLTGDVRLAASDGLVVETGEATFSETDALLRAPGPFTFERNGLRGSGSGMTYDEASDVLTILQQARILVSGDGEQAPMDLTAETAALDRSGNVLSLNGQVRVLWGAQVIDSGRALAHLTTGDTLSLLALRDDAQVAGGSGVETMRGREIDLSYADDGRTLQRVVMVGQADLRLAARSGQPGRRLAAERLDLSLAPDGSLTRAEGRGTVRFDLPAAGDAPARTVQADRLDGEGEPGQGLTDARFAGNVTFTERLARGTRTARAASLALVFEQDGVADAAFQGRVEFGEDGLVASAADARYSPRAGTLRLTGADAGGPPHVADERLDVVADAIDLTLEGRSMMARGNVKTTLRPDQGDGGRTFDGLLDSSTAAFVNAEALRYDGRTGEAVYTGSAALLQGDTAVRADSLAIDRTAGSLIASGRARAQFPLDGGASSGRADRIEYDDRARTIVYSMSPRPAGSRGTDRSARGGSPARAGIAGTTPPPPAPQAELTGPQGDLRADRVEVILAGSGGRAERLEAYGSVLAQVDDRRASGARLTYLARDERYQMAGTPGVPVTVVDACRTTTGRTLEFFKSTDRILVDGNEQVRTRTTSTGPCPASSDGR